MSQEFNEAGPSRQPFPAQQQQRYSPRRSNSLTHRQSDKGPMRPSALPHDDRDLLQPPQTPLSRDFATPSGSSSSPPSFRRVASDEGSSRSQSYTEPVWPAHLSTPTATSVLDPVQAALLQSARVKMSSQDQEAMRRIRSTLAAQQGALGSGSGPSSRAGSPTERRRQEVGTGRSRKGSGVEDQSGWNGGGVDANKTPRPFIPKEELSDSIGVPFTIAVIGHTGVGKTMVIRRAAKVWGVSEPRLSTLEGGQIITSSRSHITPNGKLKEERTVHFVEMNIDAIISSPTAESTWVRGIPPISGVILCYDATRTSTLSGIGEAITRLATDSTPMIVLACKSDPGVTKEVDAAYGNSLGEPHNVGLIEVTALTPEGKSKMRNGLRWLLFKLEQRSRRQRRRPSPLDLPPLADLKNGFIQPLKAIPTDLQSPDSEGHSSGGEKIMWGSRSLAMTSSEVEGSDKRSSAGSLEWITSAPIKVPEEEVEVESVPLSRQGSDNLRSALDMDEAVVVPVERADEVQLPLPPEPPMWLSMSDLYRKLFSYIVVGEEAAFVSTVFLTFRRFSTPIDLMREFRTRFQDIETAQLSADVRIVALQRLVGALIDWICQYPGDVISEPVQAVYREILASALRHTYLAHLTAELADIEMELIDIEDVDVSWSYNPNQIQASIVSAPPMETTTSVDSETLYNNDSPSAMDLLGSVTDVTDKVGQSAVSLSASTTSHNQKALSVNSGSDIRLPLAGIPMNVNLANGNGVDDFGFSEWSASWNAVVRCDPRTFAVELTMMQWRRFSLIRPRDIFRHDFGKERNGPVGDSIEFFNHISRWVSTMILANPKPKHRAKTYERFMLIAHHLRRLNNYDSLYAVISGMRETSVHRLTQTHALISQYTQSYKDYMGYVRLMDPRNGYSQYRKVMDPEHSDPPAIPLLTVVLGLLSRLQAVRPEDRREDGLIQWDKFIKFGEIVGVISKCQERGTMIPGDPSLAFQALIEQTPVIESEDGLFERSKMLEPTSGVAVVPGGGKVLKKLANLGLRGEI